jgi:hypothetical protein
VQTATPEVEIGSVPIRESIFFGSSESSVRAVKNEWKNEWTCSPYQSDQAKDKEVSACPRVYSIMVLALLGIGISERNTGKDA